MRFPFFGPRSQPENVSMELKRPSEPITKNYFTEIREFISKNAPVHSLNDFRGKFGKARPFVFASFIAWPVFWLYKGLDWRNKRRMDKLPNYIKRTFLQAKVMQVALITAGVVYASYESSPQLQKIHQSLKDFSKR